MFTKDRTEGAEGAEVETAVPAAADVTQKNWLISWLNAADFIGI